VAAGGRGARLRVERLREWRRAIPALLLALAAHAGLLWWLASMPAGPGLPMEEPLRIESKLVTPPDWDPLEVPPEVEEILDPLTELQDPETLEEIDESLFEGDDDEVGIDILGAGGGFGLGDGRGGGLSGQRAGGLGMEGLDPEGSPFRQFVEDLRKRGLDVVFVVDATASMGPFIQQARAAIDEIIIELATVVPSLRLGIVAYRDHSDAWLVQHTGLTDDRYRIHNFLLALEAYGGGDFPEAVDEGLRVAIRELSWRKGARRVIILVGDAPVHEERRSVMNSLIRSFARDQNSLVNVLYTGTDPRGKPTVQQRDARLAMEGVAEQGGGLIAELMTEGDDLRVRITDATFGPEWRDEVRAFVSDDGAAARKQRIIDRKVATEDRKWFLRNLARTPVHPALVAGALMVFDRSLADACLALVLDEDRPEAVRSTALHVLKRACAPGVRLDVALPLGGQPEAVEELEWAVSGVPAYSEPLPPPPR
jgi:hypothetical protein